MGSIICAVCFLRDTAGALQLHHNPLAQYIRPEIIGFVLGAFGISLSGRMAITSCGNVGVTFAYAC
jgi:hypothetical protein